MLDALLVLCLVGILFVWWLVRYYEDDDNDSGEVQDTHSSRRATKKRNKHKRAKQHQAGKTKDKVVPGREPKPSRTDRVQHRSLPQRPTETWHQQQHEEEEEEEEDLAALHAEMLKAARSFVAGSSNGEGAREGAAAAAGHGHEAGRRNSCRIGVGDKVDGRFEAGAEWFPAVVTKMLHGGFVNLLYDDGEREARVPLALVRHRGAPSTTPLDSGSSNSGSSEEADMRNLPVSQANRKQAGGWEVMVQKPKKTRVERVESRAEASSNLKNRQKRQKKREKELAAREALRKKL